MTNKWYVYFSEVTKRPKVNNNPAPKDEYVPLSPGKAVTNTAVDQEEHIYNNVDTSIPINRLDAYIKNKKKDEDPFKAEFKVT